MNMLCYVLILFVILSIILFVVLLKRQTQSNQLQDLITNGQSILPDKSKTAVYVCDPKNIPPKWPFTNYNFDGVYQSEQHVILHHFFR